MAYRKIPIVKDEIYHVFNRSNAREPIFLLAQDYQRALEVLRFYRYENPPLRFSFYNRLPKQQKEEFLNTLTEMTQMVEILAFCLMPNHFHFLLKGVTENGVKKFLANFQNSYAKYFNTRTGRTGSLFQQNYRAVRIESDEQLLHVGRYIHLNPLTSYILKSSTELESYPWGSFTYYMKGDNLFLHPKSLLEYFKTKEDFSKFTLDNLGYQRTLDRIKHLLLE